MLDLEGFMSAEIIREHLEYAAARIVMLTSSGNRGDGARCTQLDIQGYLLKPAKSSELFVAICTVMGTKSQAPQSAPLETRHSVREAHKKLKNLLAADNKVNQERALCLLRK